MKDPAIVREMAKAVYQSRPDATKMEWGAEMGQRIAGSEDPIVRQWAEHVATMAFAKPVADMKRSLSGVVRVSHDGTVIELPAAMSDGKGQQMKLWQEMTVGEFRAAVKRRQAVAAGLTTGIAPFVDLLGQIDGAHIDDEATMADALLTLGFDPADIEEGAVAELTA